MPGKNHKLNLITLLTIGVVVFLGLATLVSTVFLKGSQTMKSKAAGGRGGACDITRNQGCGDEGGCRFWEKCVNGACFDTTNGGTVSPAADACGDKATGGGGGVSPTTPPGGGGGCTTWWCQAISQCADQQAVSAFTGVYGARAREEWMKQAIDNARREGRTTATNCSDTGGGGTGAPGCFHLEASVEQRAAAGGADFYFTVKFVSDGGDGDIQLFRNGAHVAGWNGWNKNVNNPYVYSPEWTGGAFNVTNGNSSTVTFLGQVANSEACPGVSGSLNCTVSVNSGGSPSSSCGLSNPPTVQPTQLPTRPPVQPTLPPSRPTTVAPTSCPPCGYLTFRQPCCPPKICEHNECFVPTGAVTPTTSMIAGCKDTDGGNIPTTKGITTDKFNTSKTDECLGGGNMLREYWCKPDGTIDYLTIIDCEKSGKICSDGACKDQVSPTPVTQIPSPAITLVGGQLGKCTANTHSIQVAGSDEYYVEDTGNQDKILECGPNILIFNQNGAQIYRYCNANKNENSPCEYLCLFNDSTVNCKKAWDQKLATTVMVSNESKLPIQIERLYIEKIAFFTAYNRYIEQSVTGKNLNPGETVIVDLSQTPVACHGGINKIKVYLTYATPVGGHLLTAEENCGGGAVLTFKIK